MTNSISSVPAVQLRLVALVRVSTLGQADKDKTGIPRQYEANEKTRLRINGYWVRPPFELKDVSGSDVLETSEFKELIGMMKSRQLDGVVVEEFTRLCRPGTYYEYVLLQYFKDNNVTLYTRDGQIDLNKASENLMAGISAAIAGYDKIIIKGRLNAGKERRRKEGKLPDNIRTLPLFVTYDRATESWSYNDHLPKVMHCVEMVEKGQTLRECGKKIGVGHKTLGNQLRNKLLIGIREYRHKAGEEKYRSRNGRQASRKKVLRPIEDIISVKVIEKSAMSVERFARLQKLLSERHSKWVSSRAQYSDDWLNGILACGCCGQKMNLFRGKWQKSQPSRKDRYFCRSQLHSSRNTYERCQNLRHLRAEVERDVLGFVRANLCSAEHLESLVSACIKNDGAADNSNDQIKSLQNLIAEAKKEKDRFLTLFGKGGFSEEDLSKKVNPLNVAIRLDSTLLEDLKRRQVMLADTFDPKTVENIVALFSEFEFLAPTEKHRVLSLCLPKIRYVSGQGVVGASLNGSVGSELGTPSMTAP